MSIGLSDLVVAVGLMIVLEGALYALFPDSMKKIMQQVIGMPSPGLRKYGMFAVVTGFIIVWMVRRMP